MYNVCMSNPDESLSMDQLGALLRYSEGDRTCDIASDFLISPSTLRKHLSDHPESYEFAKQALALLRTAKYRHIGASFLDLQIYLANKIKDDLRSMDTIKKDLAEDYIKKNLRELSAVGEAAERRADLNEGKVSERFECVHAPLSDDELMRLHRAQTNAGLAIDFKSA